MIDYIIPENPDDRVLRRAVMSLKKGELICIPTDTNWVVCCNPYIKSAVEKLYRLKNENIHKHFSVLCANISQASEVAIIADSTFKVIKKFTPGHYTFIFNATKKITKYLKASKTDREIGIRIVPSLFVTKLLQEHNEVLLSTNITTDMLNISEDDPIYSFLIEETLGHQLSAIIDPGEVNFAGQSTIINYSNNDALPELIRTGAGSIDGYPGL